MVSHVGLSEAKLLTNHLAVSLHDDSAVVEISLLLLCLLCQDVTVVSVLTLDFSGTSKSETLLSSGLGFNFWHFFVF